MTHPYDLGHYKVTLPVNKNGELSGSAYEVMPPVPVVPWFQIDDRGFIFTCPDKGAVTKTAKFPRCELRDLREFSHTEHAYDKVKLQVLQCPMEAKIVIHQIHDKSEPWVKIVWHQKPSGGIVYALIKATDKAKDTRIELLTGVSNKQSVVSYIEYDPDGMITVKANRVLKKLPVDRKGLGGKAYFKRGNYYQNNSGSGTLSVVLHRK